MMTLKPLLRDVVARAFVRLGLTRPDRDALTIATFHRVLPEAQRDGYLLPSLAVTPDELARFLAFFTQRYTCATLDEVARRFAAGERPERPFLAVTFDDGQLDNARWARPELTRADVRATFFVPVQNLDTGQALWHDRLGGAARSLLARDPDALACLGDAHLSPAHDDVLSAVRRLLRRAKDVPASLRDTWIAILEDAAGGPALEPWDALMSWDDLRALRDEGHEIGSHSLTHPILPLCDDATLADEIAGSRRILAERLGQDVPSFCYPNGDHDTRSLRAVREAGYGRAVTTLPGRNARDADPFSLRRFDLNAPNVAARDGSFSEARLALRLSGRQPGLR